MARQLYGNTHGAIKRDRLMEEAIIKEVESLSKDMIQEVINCVNIRSVETQAQKDAPFGKGVKEALDFVLSLSKDLGFETKNVDNYMGYAKYGNSEDYVCAVGHIDVVDEGEGWKTAPYNAQIIDNRIYGRGALDNKGPILSCLFALKALKNLDIPLSKEVRILFGCDEESGFEDLKYYLTKEKPPISGFTPDCKYPVVYSERGRLTLRLSCLDANILFQFVNDYFMNFDTTGSRLGLDFKDDEYGINELRNYQFSVQENMYCFDFTCSFPASVDKEDILAKVNALKPTELMISELNYFPAVKFNKDDEMIKHMQYAYEYITGNDGTPVTTTGGTYAKMMPHIVPFGPSFPGQKGIAHNPNEWMDIDDLIANAKIYAIALYKLAK